MLIASSRLTGILLPSHIGSYFRWVIRKGEMNEPIGAGMSSHLPPLIGLSCHLRVCICLTHRNLGHRHVWERRILPEMQKEIINSMLCSQDAIDPRKVRWEISPPLPPPLPLPSPPSLLKGKEAGRQMSRRRRGIIGLTFVGFHVVWAWRGGGKGGGKRADSKTLFITLSSKVKSPQLLCFPFFH